MIAAYAGRTACVARLLAAGASANQLNPKGQHPLAGVAFKGLLEVAELLLAHGADPEGNPESARSPLMYAAMYGHTALTKRLLERGARADRRSPEGKTALDLAREMTAWHTIPVLEAVKPGVERSG